MSVIPQIGLVRAIPYTIDLGKHGKRTDWQCIHSSKTKQPNDVDLLLGQRLRRCPNTNSTSGEYLVFTEIHISIIDTYQVYYLYAVWAAGIEVVAW